MQLKSHQGECNFTLKFPTILKVVIHKINHLIL